MKLNTGLKWFKICEIISKASTLMPTMFNCGNTVKINTNVCYVFLTWETVYQLVRTSWVVLKAENIVIWFDVVCSVESWVLVGCKIWLIEKQSSVGFLK